MRPGLVALGRAQGENTGAPSANDPLSFYTMATFLPYVSSVFTLRGFNTTVEVTLTRVQDTLPVDISRAGGRESFVLEFHGSDGKLPQDTYVVEHAALGTFRLFLVPGGPDKNGSQGYVATINRLAYVSKPGRFDTPHPLKSAPAKQTFDIGTPAPSNQNPAPEAKPRRKASSEIELNQVNF